MGQLLNIVEFHYIPEACRYFPPRHLVHASSSSVYGANAKIPLWRMIKPIRRWVFTRRRRRGMSWWPTHTAIFIKYLSLARSFFTVYGPCGHPDKTFFAYAGGGCSPHLGKRRKPWKDHALQTPSVAQSGDRGICPVVPRIQQPANGLSIADKPYRMLLVSTWVCQLAHLIAELVVA